MPMTNGMYTSNTPEWETPQDLFDSLNHEFHLTLDIAASNEIVPKSDFMDMKNKRSLQDQQRNFKSNF